MSSHDISVKFSASGERTLLATLARVRTTAARISTPMVADLAKLRQVAAEFGKIGVASAGIGAVGAAAFVGSLSKARDVAADIAEQLAGIENTARGLGSTDASALGGFAFAARAAGWEGLEDVIGIGGAMREAAIAVREGDEDIIKAFGDLGIRYEDLFTFDADSRSFSGPLRSADEMLRNVAERLNDIKDAAGDVSIDESLIKILGATDAAKMQSLAEISAQTIADRIDMWNALMSNPTQDDYSAARAFRSSLHANEVAIDGMKLSFSRSLFPALIEANNQFAQFAIDNQERMGALGEAFANFVGDVEPLLLRLADVALEVAAGGEFDDTPMAAFMSRLVELAASLKDGLIDVLDYLSTGQTDVAWLNGIIDLFKAFSQGLKDIFSTLSDFNALIRDDIAPMVDALTSSVSALLDMLGVESSGGQLAVVSGLLLFSNTLTKALGLVGKLIFQIGKLGYAAAAATLTTSGASAAAGGAAAGEARLRRQQRSPLALAQQLLLALAWRCLVDRPGRSSQRRTWPRRRTRRRPGRRSSRKRMVRFMRPPIFAPSLTKSRRLIAAFLHSTGWARSWASQILLVLKISWTRSLRVVTPPMRLPARQLPIATSRGLSSKVISWKCRPASR